MSDHTRQIVVDNIRRCVAEGRLNDKVEPGDPKLSGEEAIRLLEHVKRTRTSLWYAINNQIARFMARCVTANFNRETQIEGLEKIKDIQGAAIVTSNHFAPLENSILRVMTRRNGKGNLYAVSQITNFAMKGWTGYMLRYVDLIPIFSNCEYMATGFEKMLSSVLREGHYVLMYPEQEMWWNYRKPRPCKRGAYVQAAKFGVPVISCFVEMVDKPEGGLRYVLHILDPIYPDDRLSFRDDSRRMMEQDYAQKKQAYEDAYGKPLDYTFDKWDIAGWE